MAGDTDYDLAMQQIKDLQSRSTTAEERANAYDAMTAQVNSSSSDIMEQVKILADQTIKTDRVFESIRQQLRIVDDNEYKDKNGHPIAKLEPTWKKYQSRYTDLLWRARRAATYTEAYLRDLVDVVLELVLAETSTHADNVKDLKEFANRHNPVAVDQAEDDFTKLRADVVAFVDNFSRFADDENVKLSTEITKLNDDIIRMKDEMASLDNLVLQMSIAIGVTLAAGAGGIIAAAAVLGAAAGPAAVVPILVAGIVAIIGQTAALISALTKKSVLEKDVLRKQQEIERLTAEKKVLESLKAKLLLCADQGSDMFGRLANFSDMWSNAAADARHLMDDIADIHTDITVEAKVKLMKVTYKSAADALEYYATHLGSFDASN
ncbi:hypothetical protein CVT24_008507 [Panaeolus cyanescens]|uniref:Haemolytic enterotoxin (HBL) n=1 Tax=Panaeolus cyanescens TaxID=181874 RepID=A0A409W4H6_9AGAR|nr:hypothetical protein CVT24_008507 [Panaeolus cyanescens]